MEITFLVLWTLLLWELVQSKSSCWGMSLSVVPWVPDVPQPLSREQAFLMGPPEALGSLGWCSLAVQLCFWVNLLLADSQFPLWSFCSVVPKELILKTHPTVYMERKLPLGIKTESVLERPFPYKWKMSVLSRCSAFKDVVKADERVKKRFQIWRSLIQFI